jgi:hypothetical protein
MQKLKMKYKNQFLHLIIIENNFTFVFYLQLILSNKAMKVILFLSLPFLPVRKYTIEKKNKYFKAK